MMPRMRRRASLAILLAIAAAFTAGACKENPTATEACKTEPKMSWQCRDCCHENGADGWSFFGDKCVCRN